MANNHNSTVALTEQWLDQLDENTRNFQEAFGHLGEAQLNHRPDPTTWSIAQNIDHLMVINSSYLPVLEQVRAGSLKLPFYARFSFIVSWIGAQILASVQPDRKNKVKTFPLWEPSSSDLPPDILARFTDHQEMVKSVVLDSQDLVQRGTIVTSPASPYIVYRLETLFELIIVHERRHLEQARNVKVDTSN